MLEKIVLSSHSKNMEDIPSVWEDCNLLRSLKSLVDSFTRRSLLLEKEIINCVEIGVL